MTTSSTNHHTAPHPGPHKKPPLSEFAFVCAGGLLLAVIAGFVNVAVIALGGLPVTHITGTVSRLSGDLGRNLTEDALRVAALIGAFIAGAGLSGAIIGTATLRFGRRYGVAILLEAGLLAVAAMLGTRWLDACVVLAAASAGLQNGMASSYRSLIVRTTHMTGVATDLGFHLGRLATGHRTEPWRLVLLVSLLASFIAGGIAGALAADGLGADALWLPTGVLAIMGGGYFTARQIMHARRRRSHR